MSKIAIIQFGGTGDLAKKKLLPAYKNLYKQGYNFGLLCLGRKYRSKKDYLKNMVGHAKKYVFLEYAKYNLLDSKNNKIISDYIKSQKAEQVIFYVALDPSLYKKAIEKISKALTNLGNIKKKIIIEKPFGFNYQSSQKYNKIILKTFSEKEIYRVDHYLGKEFVQNLLLMRFHNDLIQSIWNKNYIDSVQIIVDEKQGINRRKESYKKMGVVRDMLQNHILQIITHLTMAEPIQYTQKYISAEKVKILKSIRKINHYQLGEYQSLKIFIDNFNFSGIPFYIRTGKKMKNSKSLIYIKFKTLNTERGKTKSINANAMVIEIQPNMKINFVFNIKKPKAAWETRPATLSFDHRGTFKINTPKAYEQILERAIREDKSVFPSFAEIKESWKIVDSLLSTAKIKTYKDGKLPKFAQTFMQQDQKSWFV